jgi:hypothetical protein
MFPEGETVTLGFDCEGLCFVPFFECVDSVGDGAGPSTGVGGVTKVVGASTVFGGVAGIWVMIRLGPSDRRDALDGVSEPVWICGGESTMGPSRTRCSRFFPPKSAPIPAALEPGRLSVSAAGLGEAARRVGLKASFSLPTGETPRLLGVTSVVLAVRREAPSVDVSESTRVASVVVVAESTESIVSEAIRGEDSVSSPAWEACGDMPGRRGGAGELMGRLVGRERVV